MGSSNKSCTKENGDALLFQPLMSPSQKVMQLYLYNLLRIRLKMKPLLSADYLEKVINTYIASQLSQCNCSPLASFKAFISAANKCFHLPMHTYQNLAVCLTCPNIMLDLESAKANQQFYIN